MSRERTYSLRDEGFAGQLGATVDRMKSMKRKKPKRMRIYDNDGGFIGWLDLTKPLPPPAPWDGKTHKAPRRKRRERPKRRE